MVVVEQPRKVFWEGTEIPIEWYDYNQMWSFMEALAKESKSGGVADTKTCDLGVNAHRKAVTNLKYRLVKTEGFPESLAAKIVPAGSNTYKLDLTPEQIHVFAQDEDDISCL